MLLLESERLRLHPLTLPQLHLFLANRSALENELQIQLPILKPNTQDSFMREFDSVMESYVIPNVTRFAESYPWYTHWLVIHKADNRAVGGLGLYGLPNESGEVMFGYFIDQAYEGRGLTTEAVKRLIEWLFSHPTVQCVMADTLVDGFGSQRVLQKNGFQYAGETEEGFRWKLMR